MKHVDGNEILEDGDRLTVPQRFMDAVGGDFPEPLHRPGPAPRNAGREAMVEGAHEKANQTLGNAWKKGNTSPGQSGSACSEPKTVGGSNNVAKSYAEYEASLGNAWRKPE